MGAGFQFIRFRGARWRVEIYLEYREGYYVVDLIPLVDGRPRPVPFGFRTKWELAAYLTNFLGIEDEDITHLAEVRAAPRSLAEKVTVKHADEILALNAHLLTRYLAEIEASPHPPVGKE